MLAFTQVTYIISCISLVLSRSLRLLSDDHNRQVALFFMFVVATMTLHRKRRDSIGKSNSFTFLDFMYDRLAVERSATFCRYECTLVNKKATKFTTSTIETAFVTVKVYFSLAISTPTTSITTSLEGA